MQGMGGEDEAKIRPSPPARLAGGSSAGLAADETLPIAFRTLEVRVHQRLGEIAVAGSSAS